MPKFSEIPQYTMPSSYKVNISWSYLPNWVNDNVNSYGLDVNPNFQRHYVWTPEQEKAYVEYILKGGFSGKDIYCNCPGWHYGKMKNYTLVDGKQRLTAVLKFLDNQFTIFEGHYYKDYEDTLRLTQAEFIWHVNQLKTAKEVYQWYIDLNMGGTKHTEKDITKVQEFIDKNVPYYPEGDVKDFWRQFSFEGI